MALQSVAERPRESRYDAWPANRAMEQVIAERMLATALHNYHVTCTKRHVGMSALKSWDTLTETEKAFLIDFAVPAAMQAIWKGR